MSKNNQIVSINNLTKIFKNFIAVKDVSFSIKKGEIVGLLGPNGAGKNTTIQMLLGLTQPTSGTISYFDLPFDKNRTQILSRINSTSGYSRMPWRLTVRENLLVFAHLYEVSEPLKKVNELAERFEMTDLLQKKFLDLSAGQVTRSMLAKCFLNEPELVLLDEPTASLDPDIAEKIRQYIIEERNRKQLSILITSHNMTEVEDLCDKVVVLNKGEVYAIDTPAKLAARNTQCIVKMMITDGLKRTTSYLKKQNLVFHESKRFITITIEETQIAPFLTALAKHKIEYTDIEIVRPSLEDFFLDIATKGEK